MRLALWGLMALSISNAYGMQHIGKYALRNVLHFKKQPAQFISKSLFSTKNNQKNPNDRMCFEDKLFMSILAPLGVGGFGICLYQNYKNEKK